MSTIRDGMVIDGQCAESNWPYNAAGETPEPADLGELFQAAGGAVAPPTIAAVQTALVASRTAVIGIVMTDSFLEGISPIDFVSANEPTNHNHAVLAVGIDDATRLIAIKNSFGTTWGDQGYGSLTFDFFAHYARRLLLVT